MEGVIKERIEVSRWRTKEITFHFGMYVWQSIIEKHDIAYEDMDKLDPLEVTIDMLFFAAEYGEMKRGKRIKFTRADMAKWTERMPALQLRRIQKAVEKSRIGGKSILKLQEEKGGKKKQPQKK